MIMVWGKKLGLKNASLRGGVKEVELNLRSPQTKAITNVLAIYP